MTSKFQKLSRHVGRFLGQKAKEHAHKFAKNTAKQIAHHHGVHIPGLG